MGTILAGDIGGTNTRLALFDAEDLSAARFARIYPSGDYESLQAILEKFVQESRQELPGHELTRAGFGIAGPVDGGVATVTNLPWRIEAARIGERLGVEHVALVNDFSAVAYAIPQLAPGDLHPLGGGEAKPKEHIALLGAGTGLGEGFLIWGAGRYHVVSSEGGHTDFAPRNPLESRLLHTLTEKFGRVSYERVLSGRGLVSIFEFLRDSEGMEEPTDLAEEIRAGDAAAVISRRGLARETPICDRALDIFASVYGAEAGNLALKVLAKGGVYLAGGIAAKILPRMEEGGFRYAFEQKGRFTAFLETVPTSVIVHDQPGLLGAALAALQD
ncbi:MAG: glucokinase [SAR324 cluster bacterium]|nr:glucokinase [SAR324 cluster bacterium]